MVEVKDKIDEATSGEKPSIIGVVALAVDRDGNTFISHASGKTSLHPSLAKPIDKDSVFALASCTKILTAIAALRLVEQGKLNLDDASIIETHLPELYQQPIITSPPGRPLTYEDRKTGITLRHLLTHTSGSGTDLIDPRLIAWRKERGQRTLHFTGTLPDITAMPSLFQPGEGWAYGGGYDWIGLLISRIAGESLGEWMRTEVFDSVGCDAGIGFSRKEIEEKGGVVVQVVRKTKESRLREYIVPEQKSERGGGGLFASASNVVKILADLVARQPKILSKEMLDMLFTPQLAPASPALAAFHSQSTMLMAMTGPLAAALPLSSINHALGGLVITEDNAAVGKTKGTMSWGGAFGSMWFANREQGVAAFWGGSLFPPGDVKSGELMEEFVREVWKGVGGG